MKSFSFTLTLALWGYVIAVIYARYVTPFIEGVKNSLSDPNSDPYIYGGRFSRKALKVSVEALFFLAQAYFLMGWSAYAILKIRAMTHSGDILHPWVFYFLGIGICQWTLGYIALREKFNGIFSILHSVLAMGACVTFAIRPSGILPLYGWLANLMGGLK